MPKDLKTLEDQREKLYKQFASFGDFRQGTISVTFSKCGKKNCACAQPDHPGHGPRYLWNATRKGKSVAQHLRLGPELEQARQQVDTGHRFQGWCQKVVALNEDICRLRPAPEIGDEQELEALKKKLRKKFAMKRRKRSRG